MNVQTALYNELHREKEATMIKNSINAYEKFLADPDRDMNNIISLLDPTIKAHMSLLERSIEHNRVMKVKVPVILKNYKAYLEILTYYE